MSECTIQNLKGAIVYFFSKLVDLWHCLILLVLQIITVDMDKSVMEKFVFAVANKKVAGKMHKDLLDLVSSIYFM